MSSGAGDPTVGCSRWKPVRDFILTMIGLP
jgi:hypothetical protein